MVDHDKTGATCRTAPSLGFIVNPFAGLGGSVGLKGTDGGEIVQESIRRGARPLAGEKAARALARLNASLDRTHIMTAAGAMGEDAAREAGLAPIVLHRPLAGDSTGADTRLAVAAMAERGAALILFVGGDGTARDVLAAAGPELPILGVPAGVKMHSAVFGTTPANAGTLADLFLSRSPSARLRDAEVMDLDEAAVRNNRVSAHLYGYARSPYERRLAQNAKAGSVACENEALAAVARQVASEMRPGRLYILGPGTTTRRVADALGISSTLLGVDAVLDGQAVGLDLGEQALLRTMEGREAEIVVGVLGGQGSLFGRGNQQISAEVIRKVGRDRITVIATADKLVALPAGTLLVDTGDPQTDAMLAGHLPVLTGPDRKMLVRVSA